MNELDGQIALVTGGTRSIGRAITETLLAAGATVVANYAANDAAAEKFRDEAASDKLSLAQFDVADYAAVEKFFADFAERYGQLSIVVNNSGVRRDAVLAMMSRADWQTVLDINLGGVFNVCHFAVREMLAHRYGRIVNITSPSGKFGFAGQANYGASKAGMVALTRSLSKEVAKRKITVNCVSPGFIATDLLADLAPELRAEYVKQIPVGRFGAPADVANAVKFLVSPAAAYITGATLEVTGGL
ncbi:beta-ketoacyl-ACP reductase [Planctomycetales bacterium]|nr:beta-ketoacyl-ACP reductase [Planctomycetales bacterium]GHS98981.1 beta-ketoacyl-ACP reductase [Planctomycetales bacterium]GHT06972.1 beta-ketoacyl-ACP reductase [Planctomycetales bacterium]